MCIFKVKIFKAKIFKVKKKVSRLSLGILVLSIGTLTCVGCSKTTNQDSKESTVLSNTASTAMSEALECESGLYEIAVSLSGGSGKVSIQSPTILKMQGEEMMARIEWSSSSYDLMVVDGKEYEPISTEGNAVFEIPIAALDTDIKVQAETIAMSKPHMIDYTLHFDAATMKEMDGRTENNLSSDENYKVNQEEQVANMLADRPQIEGLTFEKTMDLEYANQFAIDYYEGGYKLIATTDQRNFLIIPEGKEIPKALPNNVQIICQPLSSIYLAATSTMGLFDALNGLDTIGFSGAKADEWCIENARDEMEKGNILYAGKYRNPDYEMILSGGTKLSVQSSMIDHVPEVREKLEELGISVFVDRSSYEAHPLGRCEWIKVYGALLNKEQVAGEVFKEQVNCLEEIEGLPQTHQKVAFFYISSASQVVTRQSGDYISKMIGLGGGENVFESQLDAKATSTKVMEMEHFYQVAKEADILIYNSTIDGELENISQLIEKMELLSEFKAVKEGKVFCTEENLYQETMKIGEVIKDMHAAFTQDLKDDEQMTFLYRLEKD